MTDATAPAVTSRPALVDRVAARSREVRFLRVLLWIVAIPFYVLGFLIGALWVAILFAFGAVREGLGDVRAKASRRAGGD